MYPQKIKSVTRKMTYPHLFVDKVIKSVTRKKAKTKNEFRFIRNNVIPAPRRGNDIVQERLPDQVRQ